MKCTKYTRYHLQGNTDQYISVNDILITLLNNVSLSVKLATGLVFPHCIQVKPRSYMDFSSAHKNLS